MLNKIKSLISNLFSPRISIGEVGTGKYFIIKNKEDQKEADEYFETRYSQD